MGSLKLLRSHPELAGLAWIYFIIYIAHNVFAAVFVLYAGYRFGWSIWAVGLSLALWECSTSWPRPCWSDRR